MCPFYLKLTKKGNADNSWGLLRDLLIRKEHSSVLSERNLKSGKRNWAQELRYGKKWFTETVTLICMVCIKQECFSCPSRGETSVIVWFVLKLIQPDARSFLVSGKTDTCPFLSSFFCRSVCLAACVCHCLFHLNVSACPHTHLTPELDKLGTTDLVR